MATANLNLTITRDRFVRRLHEMGAVDATHAFSRRIVLLFAHNKPSNCGGTSGRILARNAEPSLAELALHREPRLLSPLTRLPLSFMNDG
jgi:hypothetical protein